MGRRTIYLIITGKEAQENLSEVRSKKAKEVHCKRTSEPIE